MYRFTRSSIGDLEVLHWSDTYNHYVLALNREQLKIPGELLRGGHLVACSRKRVCHGVTCAASQEVLFLRILTYF